MTVNLFFSRFLNIFFNKKRWSSLYPCYKSEIDQRFPPVGSLVNNEPSFYNLLYDNQIYENEPIYQDALVVIPEQNGLVQTNPVGIEYDQYPQLGF